MLPFPPSGGPQEDRSSGGCRRDERLWCLNRVIRAIDPWTGTTQYGYDPVGNRTSLTDPAGNETTWTYDRLSRMTEARNALDQARTFTYNVMSRLIGQTDRNGRTIEYDYDKLQEGKERGHATSRDINSAAQPVETLALRREFL